MAIPRPSLDLRCPQGHELRLPAERAAGRRIFCPVCRRSFRPGEALAPSPRPGGEGTALTPSPLPGKEGPGASEPKATPPGQPPRARLLGPRARKRLFSAGTWTVSSALHGVLALTFVLLGTKVQARLQEEVILTTTLKPAEDPKLQEEPEPRDIFSNEVPRNDPHKEPSLADGEMPHAPVLDDLEEPTLSAAPAGPLSEKPMEMPAGMRMKAISRRQAVIGVGPSSGAVDGSVGTDLLQARSSASSRLKAAKAGGGGDDTENAVEHALAWLARHQDADGKWSCDAFSAHCRKPPPAPPPGVTVMASEAPAEEPLEPGGPDLQHVKRKYGDREIWELVDMREVRRQERIEKAAREKAEREERERRARGRGEDAWKCPHPGQAAQTNGVTGLALLAFLGAGYVHKEGKHKETVGRAIKYLVSEQKADGQLGNTRANLWTYTHVIPALALCEAYALSRDDALQAPAQKAVDYWLAIQSPYLAWGHNYGTVPGADNGSDVTLAAWGMQLLKAARIAGLRVDGKGAQGVRNFILNKCARNDGSYWVCGYTGKTDGTNAARTACGLVALLDLGETVDSAQVRGMARYLDDKHVPCWSIKGLGGRATVSDIENQNQYAWYYGSIGMHRLGKPFWPRWNAGMKRTLLENQAQGGCADGSWEPLYWSGQTGGRVYATAMGALTLEVYYRYLRIYE